MAVSARFDAAEVRRYYDRHTAVFVRRGQGGGAIHRAVWGPGVRTRQEAFHYVEDRIAALIDTLDRSPAHVVDLGCGVGATLCYLAARRPVRATGITLSPKQVAAARRIIAAAGLSDRVVCLEGDYSDLPAAIDGPADVALAIESFVHGPSPQRFFRECARILAPGGLLAICDDVERAHDGEEAATAIEAFEIGWHVNALVRRDDLIAMASDAGLEHVSTEDLTPFLELNRLRDRGIAAYVALLRLARVDLARFDYLSGGTALQTCLARGWIGYELNIFCRQ